MSRFRIQEFVVEPESCQDALKMISIEKPYPNDTAVLYYNKHCINKPNHKPIDYSTISAKK
jgi:hypothetical protein